MNITEITTDERLTGICPGRDKALIEGLIKEAILEEEPIAFERFWQKLYMDDYRKPVAKGEWIATISHVDMAIWDLIGKITKQPVYKLLDGYANEVSVYVAGDYYFNGKSPKDLG